jgi:hypothetical protein
MDVNQHLREIAILGSPDSSGGSPPGAISHGTVSEEPGTHREENPVSTATASPMTASRAGFDDANEASSPATTVPINALEHPDLIGASSCPSSGSQEEQPELDHSHLITNIHAHADCVKLMCYASLARDGMPVGWCRESKNHK